MSWTVLSVVVCACSLARTQVIPGKSRTNDGDYNTVNTDGSFDFGYANKDRGSSYHLAHGNVAGVVGGRFGSKDPATDTIKETVYTAGPRGFRAKGPNVHRKMDLDQRPRGPIGNKDDPYFDPNEDPSYSFKFDTRSHSRNENADSRGDVKGHYTFLDDVGERHDVSYIAGRDTGFHVSSAHPDNPNLIGSLFHHSPLVRGETRPRGRTAVQRGLDGSYRFISAGPDQRRTESSDSHGNVRGSYTFLDDKGVQRTVNYIAGPGIGYRIVKNGKDPYIPAYFPTIPSPYDPDFVNAGATVFSPDDTGADDVFKRPEATAASGHVKPPPFPADKDRPGKKPTVPTGPSNSEEDDSDDSSYSPGGSSFGQGTGSSGFGQGGGIGGGQGGGIGHEQGGGIAHGQSGGVGHGQGSGGVGSRPTSGGVGSRPSSGGLGSRPSSGGVGSRPSSGGSNYGPGTGGSGQGTGGSGFGQGTGGAGFGQGTGGSGFGPGTGGSSFGQGPGGSSFVEPTGGDDASYVDEDSSYGGLKPTKGPGKPGRPRPTSKPYRPTKKPYVPLKPFQTTNNKDDDFDADTETDDKNTPQFAIGFNIQPKPGSNTIYKPGTTIIRNIGQDYFGVPPGVSVRAHVQSIDLYPYDSKPITPAEAIEKDKT